VEGKIRLSIARRVNIYKEEIRLFLSKKITYN